MDTTQIIHQADQFDELINLPRMQKKLPLGSTIKIGFRTYRVHSYYVNAHNVHYVECISIPRGSAHSFQCESLDDEWENKFAITHEYRTNKLEEVCSTKD